MVVIWLSYLSMSEERAYFWVKLLSLPEPRGKFVFLVYLFGELA